MAENVRSFSVNRLIATHNLFKIDQRNLGMSMKVERCTVDQIKQRFDFNKKKREEEKKKYGVDHTKHFYTVYSLRCCRF